MVTESARERSHLLPLTPYLLPLTSKKMLPLLQNIADLLIPRYCPVCGKPLAAHERDVCTKCLAHLPRTQLHRRHFNVMEQLFAGKTPIERATGYFWYERANRYSQILQSIKYRNKPGMGTRLAKQFALEIAPDGFFAGIDAIIPIPLHSSKLAQRGYNQSEYIARGISQATRIPVMNVVTAAMPHATQTRKGNYARYLNVRGIFSLKDPESLQGKHVLLVDDVVTTGATLLSCAEMLNAEVQGIKISLATLAVARLD